MGALRPPRFFFSLWAAAFCWRILFPRGIPPGFRGLHDGLGDALRLRVPLEPAEFHGDAALKQVGRMRTWVLEEDVDERPGEKKGAKGMRIRFRAAVKYSAFNLKQGLCEMLTGLRQYPIPPGSRDAIRK